MKKKILFYVGWDLIFLAYLYVYSELGIKLREQIYKSLEPLGRLLWFDPIGMIIFGGLLAILIHRGSKHQTNRKSAVLEFFFVGLPALFVATPLIGMYGLSNLLADTSLYGTMYLPYSSMAFWLLRTQTVTSIGGILLGYELYIFLFRVIPFYKKHEVAEETPLDS